MFKVAGVSTLKGEVKVRFANDMTRVKVLTKNGHTNVELMELPQPMEKAEVVRFLKTTPLYGNPEFAAAIDAADSRYNETVTVKVTKEKTKPAKPSLESLKARVNSPEADTVAE